MKTVTKPSHRLTLSDRLSQLSFTEACKLLGPQGRQLIRAGGRFEVEPDDVRLVGDLFRLSLPPDEDDGPGSVVTITLRADQRQRLLWNCTTCETLCEHIGAAFSLILERKSELGLAAPPPERMPVEALGEAELVERAIAERRERAHAEK